MPDNVNHLVKGIKLEDIVEGKGYLYGLQIALYSWTGCSSVCPISRLEIKQN